MKPIKIVQGDVYYKEFPITSICRADLESAGFNITDISDDMMLELASKMANAYCDMGFWEDLKIIAEYLGAKRKKGKNPLVKIKL